MLRIRKSMDKIKRKSVSTNVLLLAAISLVIVVIFQLLLLFKVHYGLYIVSIKGDSMEPAYMSGDKCIVVTENYNIKRNDVVIVRKQDKTIIKRIYALPGEIVTIKQNKNTNNITLNSNQYYILGDNKAISHDSRSYGPIEKEQIIAKVILNIPTK